MESNCTPYSVLTKKSYCFNKITKQSFVNPSFKLVVALSLLLFSSRGWGQTTTENFTTAGSTNWICPAGVTTVTVHAWGGGGAGGGVNTTLVAKAGGGGGGGAYTTGTVSVSPGTTYVVVVGAGGIGVSAANGNPGGSSTFNSTSIVAVGGSGGAGHTASVATAMAGGGGGASASCVPSASALSGGAGATSAVTPSSGAGGGSAGSGSAGGAATGTTAGAAGTGTYPGGAGATGVTTNAVGATATAVGGGGSGARGGSGSSTARVGGNGAAGKVILIYTLPACSGTPTPGNTIASANPVSGGASTTLSLQNATTGTGVSYQWQSSSNNSTWADIIGATSTTYVASPTTATYYRCNVTCSGNTGASNSLFINLTYCTPTSSSSATYFSNFVTTGGQSNISNNTGAFATNGYADYYSTQSASYYATGTLNFSATIAGGTAGIAVYVNWNNDLDFSDVGETVYTSNAYQSTGTTTSSFVIPSGTANGDYRMRIVTDYNSTNPASCTFSSGRGEIEDYKLTIVTAPNCLAQPSSLISSSITSSSATISWTASTSAPASGYEYYLSNSSTAPTATTTITGSVGAGVTTANLTGLTANTTYYFWVRSNCNGTDKSNWAGSGNFYTGYCTPSSSSSGCSINYISFSTTNATTNINNPTTCASSGNYTDFTATQTASHYPNGSITCNFGATTSATSFIVLVDWNNDFDFADAGETVVSIPNSGGSTAAQSGSFTIPNGTALGNYRMRIRCGWYFDGLPSVNCTATSYGEAEDYTLQVIVEPPCAAQPSTLTSSAITSSSATISWTAATSTPASGYEYYLSTSSTAPTGTTTVTGSVGAGVTTANLTGLSASTTYYFWVRSKCNGTDNSNWSGSATFTTPCATFSLPFTQGFNVTSNTSSSPNCWSQQLVSGSLAINQVTAPAGTGPTGFSPQEGTGMIFYNSYSNSTTTRLVTPVITTTGTSSVDVEFQWYYSSSGGSTSYTTEGVTVQWSTDGSTWNNFTNNFIRRYRATTGWQKITLTLPSGAGNISSLYVGFNMVGNSGYDIYMDYVDIHATPSCSSQPTTLTSSAVSSTAATISWTAASPAPGNGYEYYISTSSTAPTATTTATGSVGAGVTSINLTGLSASTTYYFWVRSNCNGTDKSNWAGSSTFISLPLNDACSSAIELTAGAASITGNTFGALAGSGFCSGTADYDVWYKFTPNCTGLYTLSVTGSTTFNSVVQAYSDCSGTLINNTAGNSCIDLTGNAATENPSYSLTSGIIYYFRVYDKNGAGTNDFTIAMSNVIVNAPTNLTGSLQVCPNTQYTYSVDNVSGATFNWTLPIGWSGTSTTNSITITTSSTAGTISASLTNSCGTSTLTSISTTIKSAPSGVLASVDNASICIGTTINLAAVPNSGGTGNYINESFSTSTTPSGYTLSAGTGDVVAIENSVAAGGSPSYELVFSGNSQTTNITDRVTIGPINTTGNTSMNLSWRNYLYHYLSDYSYQIAVETSTDNSTWHSTGWGTNPVTASIGPNNQNLTLNNSDIGSSTLYISFKMSGLTFGCYNWYIDDVVLAGNDNYTYNWTTSTNALTTSVQNPSASPLVTTIYTLTVTSSTSSCSSTDDITVIVNTPNILTSISPSDYVWLGSTNTDWNTSTNWVTYNGSTYSVAGSAPQSTSTPNVIIPATSTNCPVSNFPNTGATTLYGKNVTIESGASVTMGSGIINISGDFTNNGTFTCGTGKVIFNGAVSAQTIGGNTSTTFYNLTMNNTAGLTVSKGFTVNNELMFTSGNINAASSSEAVTFETTGFVSATTGSVPADGKCIVGYCKKNTNSTSKFTFPIGSSTVYRPASITPSTSDATTWTTNYVNQGPTNFNVTGANIDHVSRLEYWNIDRAGVTPSNATIELTWNTNSVPGTNFSDMIVAHYTGAAWETAGGNAISGTTASGVVSSDANWSSFSPFTLGSKSSANPLPVVLSNFTALCKQQKTQLNWITQSELNNDYFTIERSKDGSLFNEVGRVNGNGTTNLQNTYQFFDELAYQGTSYYRLSQHDFNGATKVYPIKTVSCADEQNLFSIYPNPNNGTFEISGLNEGNEVVITDVLGKKVGSLQYKSSNEKIQLNTLKPGVYFVEIKDAAGKLTIQKVIIEY